MCGIRKSRLINWYILITGNKNLESQVKKCIATIYMFVSLLNNYVVQLLVNYYVVQLIVSCFVVQLLVNYYVVQLLVNYYVVQIIVNYYVVTNKKKLYTPTV
jgi:hypothetical protein